jgi:hypothetical protein
VGVILTVRNPQRWYESARNTIFNLRDAAPPRAPGWLRNSPHSGFDGDVEDHGRMGEGLQRIGNGKGISPLQPAHYLDCKLHAWVRLTRPRPYKDGVKLEDDLQR